MIFNITLTDRITGLAISGANVQIYSVNTNGGTVFNPTGTTDANGFVSLDNGPSSRARILVTKSTHKSRSIYFIGNAPTNSQNATYAIPVSTVRTDNPDWNGLYNTSFSIEGFRQGQRDKAGLNGFSIESFTPNEPKRVAFRGFSIEKYRSLKTRKLIKTWH